MNHAIRQLDTHLYFLYHKGFLFFLLRNIEILILFNDSYCFNQKLKDFRLISYLLEALEEWLI